MRKQTRRQLLFSSSLGIFRRRSSPTRRTAPPAHRARERAHPLGCVRLALCFRVVQSRSKSDHYSPNASCKPVTLLTKRGACPGRILRLAGHVPAPCCPALLPTSRMHIPLTTPHSTWPDGSSNRRVGATQHRTFTDKRSRAAPRAAQRLLPLQRTESESSPPHRADCHVTPPAPPTLSVQCARCR